MHSKVKLQRAKFGEKLLKTDNKRHTVSKWKKKKPSIDFPMTYLHISKIKHT